MPDLYPIFLRLAGRPVTVVGGGEVAARKVEALLGAGARVTVVSPEVDGEIAAWAREGRLVLEPRAYAAGDLERAVLAIAATSDRAVNEAVAAEANAARIPVNVVDVPDLCGFYVPAIFRDGDFALAVSTGGGAPALAGAIRAWLQRSGLGPRLAAVCRDVAARRLTLAGKSMDDKRTALAPFIRERFEHHGVPWHE